MGAGHGEELLAGTRVVAEQAAYSGGDRPGAGGAPASPRRAQMIGFKHHGDTRGLMLGQRAATWAVPIFVKYFLF
jgi:hypothetical protein